MVQERSNERQAIMHAQIHFRIWSGKPGRPHLQRARCGSCRIQTIFPIIRSLKMTKRFPLAVFGIFILFGISVNTYLALKGYALSQSTGSLWTFTLSYIIAWGVESDRKLIRFSAPFEFSAFVFFAWPIVVPYYLFKTRGWSGLGSGIALLAAAILPDLATVAASFLRLD